MTTQDTAKVQGPWFHRFLVGLFSLLLTVLFYWLLGFVVNDIGRWPGPSHHDFEASRLDQKLVDRSTRLEAEIMDARRGIKDVQTRQTLLRDSTTNSQQTMRQLLEMQQLHLQKGVTPLPQEQQALADSETLFLANQKQYREAYEVFLCPVCGYPIRRGPLKYAFWNRRSIKKLGLPREATPAAEQPYTCPMCSTQLFEECPSCHAMRHSLLPTCETCGTTRPVAGLPTT